MDGSRIIGEIVRFGNSEFYRLTYLYDDYDGSPVGMQYRTPSMAQGVFYTYWFEKNLQGDIVAVYNEEATKLVSYTYDAWGNFSTTISNYNGTNWIASYNPFRYRGYYYDTETGYYYLNSRYYNPNWGRFLNADGYVSTGSGLLGYNMFAYCNNNPVMYVDPEGIWPQWFDKLKEKIEKKVVEVLATFYAAPILLAEDFINYDPENTDPEKVYNSHYFSSYNGALVVRHSSEHLTSWAVGGIIFLNHDEDTYRDPPDGLKHEYGHVLQEKEIGRWKYAKKVAIPSTVFNVFTNFGSENWFSKNYYNTPWEYDADIRGGSSQSHSGWAEIVAKIYWG